MVRMKPRTTPKPIRLTIPVDPETHAVFQRLADVGGKSLGAAMGEWLQSTRDAAASIAMQLDELQLGVRRASSEIVARHEKSPRAVALDGVAKAKRSAAAPRGPTGGDTGPQRSAQPSSPRLVIRGGKSQAGQKGRTA